MLDVAAYFIYIAILVYAAVTDWRTLRIPNNLVIAIMLDWLIWQVLRDVLPRFWQPELLVVLGPEAGAISAANGVLAAIVFGAGLMLFTLAYEAVTHKYSMGGGDVKLMVASALFLGLQRSLFALMIACVAAVFLALVYSRTHRGKGKGKDKDKGEGAENESCSELAFHAHRDKGKGVEAVEAEIENDDCNELAPHGIPFGPAIAIGSAIALLV